MACYDSNLSKGGKPVKKKFRADDKVSFADFTLSCIVIAFCGHASCCMCACHSSFNQMSTKQNKLAPNQMANSYLFLSCTTTIIIYLVLACIFINMFIFYF